MKKNLYSMFIFLLISITFLESKAEIQKELNTKGLKEYLLKARAENSVNRQKKKKLKKLVRKTGRIYRIINPDAENRKKSRKIQRKTRRIINIF